MNVDFKLHGRGGGGGGGGLDDCMHVSHGECLISYSPDVTLLVYDKENYVAVFCTIYLTFK
jgi:hypothetical protein